MKAKFLSTSIHFQGKFGPIHTTKTIRNKHEKLDGKGEGIFVTPFMIQSHAESLKKIVGALWNLPAN